MKRVYIYIAISIFTVTLLFSLSLDAADESGAAYPKNIIGQVTSVGQQALTIQEDTTQTVYTLAATQSQLKDLQTGYRVEVKTTGDGKVSSLTILGKPMQVESDPEQKWKVIIYPEGHVEKRVITYPPEASPAASPAPSPAINP
jgi:hypothetical protein